MLSRGLLYEYSRSLDCRSTRVGVVYHHPDLLFGRLDDRVYRPGGRPPLALILDHVVDPHRLGADHLELLSRSGLIHE